MKELKAGLGRGLFCALVAVALLLASSAARADEKISDEAKLYFRNGVDLIQATPPNYQDAYYQFKLAYEKSQSWKVLGNLGLCALKLERDGEALDAYNEYLKSGGKEVDPEERKALERDILLISGNTAVVNLTSASPDADLVDTRAGSSVPPQTYKFVNGALLLRLRAGSHTLSATSSDGKQEKWEVSLTPGRTVEHRFEFAPPPAAPPPVAVAPPAPTAPPPPDEGAKKGGAPLRTIGIVTAAVGAGALVGGVITGVMARSAESRATDACNADNVCPTRAEDDFDSAASLATVTNVLLIGGGVLAAAGIGMIVIGGSGGGSTGHAKAPPPRLRLSPAVSGDGAGLFATGAF